MRDRISFFCWSESSTGSCSVSGDELVEIQLTAEVWTLFPNSDDVEGNLHWLHIGFIPYSQNNSTVTYGEILV